MDTKKPEQAVKMRALVIEDSAYNRRALKELLESDGDVEVVGLAADGETGLQQAFSLNPDVICLDLEMPRMDGFTFLRILMSRQPTPVIVVSSQVAKQNVFRALEFGALDFVPKPSATISPKIREIRSQLLEKVRLARNLRLAQLEERARARANRGYETGSIPIIRAVGETPTPAPVPLEKMRLLALGASTGGPPAVQQILMSIDAGFAGSVLVTQHMPERFTRSFAERLNRLVNHPVAEAEDGTELTPGMVLISPGNASLGVFQEGDRGVIRLSTETHRYVPSVDYMLTTAAAVFGDRMMAIVLTGMGSDGMQGVGPAKTAGATILAESEETAVIPGMPGAAVETGHVDRVLPLGALGYAARRFMRSGNG